MATRDDPPPYPTACRLVDTGVLGWGLASVAARVSLGAEVWLSAQVLLEQLLPTNGNELFYRDGACHHIRSN